MPDQAPHLIRFIDPVDYLLNSAGLVLPENDLDQVIIFGKEDYVVAQELKESLPIEEGLNGMLIVALELIFPIEDILPGS